MHSELSLCQFILTILENVHGSLLLEERLLVCVDVHVLPRVGHARAGIRSALRRHLHGLRGALQQGVNKIG